MPAAILGSRKPHLNMLKTRLSQLKMLETISVLLVFTVLLTFVLFFYVSVSKSESSHSNDEKSQSRAVVVSQLASYLPEFQCSTKNIIEDVCFDTKKLEGFIAYTHGEGAEALGTDYFDMFGYSLIKVYQIYPLMPGISSANEWVVYNRSMEKPGGKKLNEQVSYVPISLYEPNSNIYSFGIMVVRVYS